MEEAFVVYDADGYLITCNVAFRTLYNYSPEQAHVGVHYRDLGAQDVQSGNITVHEGSKEDYLKRKRNYRKFLQGHFDVQLKDGRWIRTNDRKLSNGGLVSTQMDITAQKKNEAALNLAKETLEQRFVERSAKLTESELLFQRVVDNLPIGVCLKDEDGKVLMANRQILEWWGISENEAIGKTTDEISSDPEEVCRVRREQERVVWETCKIQSRNHQNKTRPDGSLRHIIIRKIPIFDGEGKMISLCNTVQDITDIEIAETANKAKSEFLSSMSHELRTPLTSSIGGLGLLKSVMADSISDDGTELLEIALRNNQALLRLVNELLDYEKILAGGLDIETHKHNICELTSDIIKNNQGYARTHSVNFIFSESPAPLFSNVQEHRFEQVLSNLMSNAAKFSEPNTDVNISVASDNDFVFVRVKDYGAGIPDDFKPIIFDQFTQADSSSTRQRNGTGLGLSISKQLIEAMGGSLQFESEIGVGSTFIIELPISQ